MYNATLWIGTSTITASTTPPVPAGTNICFEIVINSLTDPSMLFDTGAPFCFGATSLGQAVVGLQGGDVTTQEAVTVLGCIDNSGTVDVCDGTDPSNFVTVTVTPPLPTPTPTPTPAPPPLLPIQIVAVNPMPPAAGSTFIDVFANVPQGSVLCVEILAESIVVGMPIITGPIVPPLTPVGTACALADAAGDAIGLINLLIPVTAMAGEQVSLDGCIDAVPNDFMCVGGTDIFSPAIVVTVP